MRRGFTFLENGVHFYVNNIIFIFLGVHAFDKGVNFLERGFMSMKNTK